MKFVFHTDAECKLVMYFPIIESLIIILFDSYEAGCSPGSS